MPSQTARNSVATGISPAVFELLPRDGKRRIGFEQRIVPGRADAQELRRAGILIRDIETLERAGQIGAVAFDKTGTLTLGRPTVTAVAALDGDAERLLGLAAAVESKSKHPLGKALVAHAEASGIVLTAARDVRAIYGQGLTGIVDGETVAVGNERLATSFGAKDPQIASITGKLGGEGTLAFVMVGGRLAAAFVLPTRPGRRPPT